MSSFCADIIYSEKFVYPKGWSFMAHEHFDRYHLFYVKSSECVFTVNSEKYAVSAGELLIVPPGVKHILEECECSAEVYEVMFTLPEGELFRAINSMSYKHSAGSAISELLEYVIKYGVSRREELRQYACSCLTSALFDLAQPELNTSESHINAQLVDVSGYSRITVDVIVYIDKNYSRPVLLDDIAESIGCNKSYMCTLFKKECGITVNDYLNTIRIIRAAEFISYTNRDISYICSSVGFGNLSHFNRTFKKFMGMSPGCYKRMSPLNFNETWIEGCGDLESKLNAVSEKIGSIRNMCTGGDEHNPRQK